MQDQPSGRRRDLTQPPVCAPAEVCTPMAHPTCPRAAPQAPALATARAPNPRRALARRHSRHEKYCARRRRFTFRKHPGRRAVRCRACDDKRANIFWRLRNKKACKRLPTCIITPRSTTRIARARQTTHISDSHPARTPSACAQLPRAQLRARALGGIAARGIRVIGGGLGDLAPRTLARPARKATTLCTLPRRTSPAPALAQFDSTELSVFASSTQARRKCFSSGGRQAWRHAHGIAGCALPPWPPRTPPRPSTL